MFLKLAPSAILACALLAAPLAAEAAPRVIEGKTSQGYRIKLRMHTGALQLLRFKADLDCRDGSQLQLQESGFLKTTVRRDGRFRDAQFGRTDAVRFRGRVTAKAIRGRMRLEDRLGKERVRCTSRWIRFTVRR